MLTSPKPLIIPILIMTVGTGWLLTTRQVIPGVDWIWILGLAVIGILTLVVGGVNKLTTVLGPFLIVSSFFAVLRQTGRIDVDTEIPCLVILLGALMFAAHLLPIPAPAWLAQGTDPSDA